MASVAIGLMYQGIRRVSWWVLIFTTRQVAQKMLENKISGLPVVDSKGGHLVGIITESDIFRIVAQEWSTYHHGSIRLPRKSKMIDKT